ncbi:MAG: hypothetical protein Q8K32_10960 [Archangium sp.]|nr:hypothetical protein [Archangium sp.]
MSAWAQVDAWAGTQPLKPKPGSGWCAFAKTAGGYLRFRARPNDRRIKVERPCDFRPGGWRSKGFVDRDALVRKALDGVARGHKGAFARLDRTGLVGLTPDQARAVLVALDLWLEGGAKRMSRPMVIP